MTTPHHLDPAEYRRQLEAMRDKHMDQMYYWQRLGQPHIADQWWAKACRVERELKSISTAEFLDRR